MKSHFLLEPGEWLGEGQVHFSFSPEILRFRTKWVVASESGTSFRSTQTVEIVDGDRIVNIFHVHVKSPTNFNIELQNDLLGTFSGQGVVDDNLVAWEFRQPGVFEGYEVYEWVKDNEYSMHAEYFSSDQARTMIRGRLWKKQGTFDLGKDKEVL